MPQLPPQFSLHRPLRAQQSMSHLLAVKIPEQLVCFAATLWHTVQLLCCAFFGLLMLCEPSSSHQATVFISMRQQQQDLHCGQALHCKQVILVHVLPAHHVAHGVRYLSGMQVCQSKHSHQIQDKLLLGAQQSIWNRHQAQSHLASLSHQLRQPTLLPAKHTVLLQHSLTDACGLKHSPKKLNLTPPSSQLTLSNLLTCLPHSSAGQQQLKPAHHHH